MTYAISYGMRITGKVTGGKLAGKVLSDERHEVLDARSVADAVAKAESYRPIFTGTIEIYSRQWVDKKPVELAEGARYAPSPRGRGGFVFCDKLAVVECA